MKHKHYDMIVAKAANMDLVVFSKCGNDKWKEAETPTQFPLSEFVDVEYFLCLPQHKETCLNWLNDGEAQTIFEGEWAARATPKSELGDWFSQVIWMQDVPIRIKPKKEKRLIVVNGDYVEFALIERLYPESAQFIEIEVEV